MTKQHLPIWSMFQLPTDVCDQAIAELELLTPKDAAMGVNGDFEEHSKRNTTVRFADQNYWLGKLMFDFALESNVTSGWEYVLSGHEAVQYGQYGPGQHYGWHTDTFTLSGQPFDRKVSVVLLLSEPDEFEGGEFLMRLYNEYQPELKKGTLMAFPSILEHQVLPVTKGLRKSAVIWAYGPRFR